MELNLYEKIANRQEKISVIGLGYVGLPVATLHNGAFRAQRDSQEGFISMHHINASLI